MVSLAKVLPTLAHLAHGFIAGFLAWLRIDISAFLYLQFVLYEYVEEEKIKDEMYHELKEWATGFVFGLLFYQIGTLLYPLLWH